MPRWGIGQPRRPSLASLFAGFVSIGMMSFGGGLAAWIRREVVQRRGWLDDQQFLSGYALSQLVPGATNVNLAVFIGAQLRGVPGAVAAVLGLTALPVAIVLVLGVLYLHSQGMPGGTLVQHRADRHGRGGDRPEPGHRHPAGAAAYPPAWCPRW